MNKEEAKRAINKIFAEGRGNDYLNYCFRPHGVSKSQILKEIEEGWILPENVEFFLIKNKEVK